MTVAKVASGTFPKFRRCNSCKCSRVKDLRVIADTRCLLSSGILSPSKVIVVPRRRYCITTPSEVPGSKAKSDTYGGDEVVAGIYLPLLHSRE